MTTPNPRTARLLLLSLVIGLPVTASAHPVSYQGATAIQFFSDDLVREAQVYHSVTPRFALGGRYLDVSLPGRESRIGLLGVNTLLKRWNMPDSQANIYFSTAFGGEKRKSSSAASTPTSTAALFELDADWENRRYYAAAAAKVLAFSSLGPMHTYTGRLGIAPYLAEYGELQTWLILEGSRLNEARTSAQITPLLRFFYRNALWEVGRSFDGMWKFNFMIHL